MPIVCLTCQGMLNFVSHTTAWMSLFTKQKYNRVTQRRVRTIAIPDAKDYIQISKLMPVVLHNQSAMENPICNICNNNATEDEFHVISKCSFFPI